MSDGCSKHKYKADAIHCETCAAWASAEYNQKRAETAEAEIEKLMADAAPEQKGKKMSKWQPIETAPKDGTRILLYRGRDVVCGKFCDDRFAQRPKGYWEHDQERIWGTRDARANAPSHWMPLPEPPDATEQKPETCA